MTADPTTADIAALVREANRIVREGATDVERAEYAARKADLLARLEVSR